MADVSYVPGALTAVTGAQCWALVEISAGSPAVARIWQQLGQGAAADALLASLVANGMDGTPGFALLVAETGGQHRLFCRGTVGATVIARPAGGSAPPAGRPAAGERVDGAGLLTWREQAVGNAERIFLGEPPADTAMRLPATSGVLLAGCVVIDLAGSAAPEKTAVPTVPFTANPAGPPPGPARPGDPGPASPPAPPPPDPAAEAPGPVLPGEQPYVPAAPQVKRAERAEIIARTSPPDRIGPVVPALICPAGHVNPPGGVTCRQCGGQLPHDPVPVPRPVLGVLRLSQGDAITLDRGVLMGRNPRTDFDGPDGPGGPGRGERPHVVKLPSADGDISRTHLRVTLDGWHVLVTDLHSTNGTLVTPPGREPVQLRPGEPMPIQPGTIVTLADDVDFRYEAAES